MQATTRTFLRALLRPQGLCLGAPRRRGVERLLADRPSSRRCLRSPISAVGAAKVRRASSRCSSLRPARANAAPTPKRRPPTASTIRSRPSPCRPATSPARSRSRCGARPTRTITLSCRACGNSMLTSFIIELASHISGRIGVNRDVLVFVHGYNTSFDEARLTAAQIAADAKIGGVAVLFTWPIEGPAFRLRLGQGRRDGVARRAAAALHRSLRDARRRQDPRARPFDGRLAGDGGAAPGSDRRQARPRWTPRRGDARRPGYRHGRLRFADGEAQARACDRVCDQ